MTRTKVTIKNLQRKIPISPKKVERAVRSLLARESAGQSFEADICFMDDKSIRDLNCFYHGSDAATDVLSFDLGTDGKKRIVEIFVSTDTAVSNSRRFKTTPLQETYLYVIHGLLHTLGYDDARPEDSKAMALRQKQYLEMIF